MRLPFAKCPVGRAKLTIARPVGTALGPGTEVSEDDVRVADSVSGRENAGDRSPAVCYDHLLRALWSF